MGSTPKRMEQFAYFIMHEIGCELPSGTILNDISKSSHRYAMFKVGPVLSVSVSYFLLRPENFGCNFSCSLTN